MAQIAADPQRFGKYQILERIASGGMAEVFKARLDGIGGFHRTFAIKRILPHLTQNAEFVDMLVDEAKIAGLLSHANIVQILDLGTIDQHYYIAMEYVNGRDLGQVLQRCEAKGITLPVPHAVYALLEVLKGLEYAHNRQVMRGGRPVPLNIVHRDISPANILMSFQGEVKLTDFGIAKASVKALETMSGVVKGRFDYMSPEQAAGQATDHRADIFAAGVVLYELLAGQHPFRRQGELATIEAVRKGEFSPPSYVNPDVPYALDVIVEAALKPRPEERYADATAFKAALDRFFHDAGFIFSASTLAAFLRGLFPEAEARPAKAEAAPPRRSLAEDDTKLLQPDDVDLEDDSSSTRQSLPKQSGRATAARGATEPSRTDLPGLVPPPRQEPEAATRPGLGVGRASAAAALRSSAPEAPRTGLGEESTLIRSPGSSSAGWGDGETAVRADPNANAAIAVAAAAPAVVAPAVAAAVPARPAPAAPRLAIQVHIVYVVATFTALVSGFALGLLLGSSARHPQAAAALPDPVVEVRFPAGGHLQVDGRNLAGGSPIRASVEANRPIHVRFTAPDGAVVETTLTLSANETRLLTFGGAP
jgi:serine/threonine-protein kinase